MHIKASFDGTNKAFPAKFESFNKALSTEFDNVQYVKEVITEEVEPYEGKYEVTPTAEGEVLPTKDKKMRDDVTVKAIPYYEVRNPSGGTTLYIASSEEIEFMEG